MPEAFATVAELAALTDRELPDDDPGAQLALELATGAVQTYARQRLTLVDDDTAELLADRHGYVELPERPVLGVTAVELDDGTTLAPSAYAWGAGRLWRVDGARLTGRVRVTYAHGFATVPDDVRGVVLAAAARLLDNPDSTRSAQLGGVSTTAALLGLELGEHERATMRRYRRTTYS